MTLLEDAVKAADTARLREWYRRRRGGTSDHRYRWDLLCIAAGQHPEALGETDGLNVSQIDAKLRAWVPALQE